MEDSSENVAPVGKIESFILNQGPPTPGIKNNYKLQDNNKLILLNQKLDEQEKEINELKKNNKQFKSQLNETFQNIISIYNQIENFNKLDSYLNIANEIDLNFPYNKLDNKLYQLEDSYKSLNHEIIKTRSEYTLINSGIKHILNSNISKCKLKYKSSVDGENPNNFYTKYNNIFYKLLIIKTFNERRFGVFFFGKERKNKDENYNNYGSNDFNENNFFSSINSFENFINDTLTLEFLNNNKNQIFSCNNFEKYFIFSLNKGKIYYSRKNNSSNIPCFSINYDSNKEKFYGKEVKLNNNSQINEYILSGKEEFNILEIELYEIEIE